MNYNLKKDLLYIRELLGLTQEELANKIGLSRSTIAKIETENKNLNDYDAEKIYSFAYKKNIRLGRIKEMFCKENITGEHRLLFHGSKSNINGIIDINKSRKNNDFGIGFYTSESYAQAVSFVSNFSDSSVYFFNFDLSNLSYKKYFVTQEWMMTIAYYRGRLNKYKDHPIIINLIEQSKGYDYIIAPIADNRMFQIIDSFIDGEITDEQCNHCLAATNLGNQYIFKSDNAVKKLELIDKCYISNNEKDHYVNIKNEEVMLSNNKVKLARIEYRGKGKYIDEILNGKEFK